MNSQLINHTLDLSAKIADQRGETLDEEFVDALASLDEDTLQALYALKKAIHDALREATKQQIEVEVGNRHYASSTGALLTSSYRTVSFEGVELATLTASREQTSGTDKELYETGKGLIVHLYHWSRWQGTTERKRIVGPLSPKELSKKHPELARKADLEVPAGLTEVLDQ